MKFVCEHCGKDWHEQPCFVRAERLKRKVWLCCDCANQVRWSIMRGSPERWQLG